MVKLLFKKKKKQVYYDAKMCDYVIIFRNAYHPACSKLNGGPQKECVHSTPWNRWILLYMAEEWILPFIQRRLWKMEPEIGVIQPQPRTVKDYQQLRGARREPWASSLHPFTFLSGSICWCIQNNVLLIFKILICRETDALFGLVSLICIMFHIYI